MREEALDLEEAEQWFEDHSEGTGIWCKKKNGDEKYCNTLDDAEEFFEEEEEQLPPSEARLNSASLVWCKFTVVQTECK